MCVEGAAHGLLMLYGRLTRELDVDLDPQTSCLVLPHHFFYSDHATPVEARNRARKILTTAGKHALQVWNNIQPN
jgi:dienelactone hydrolase